MERGTRKLNALIERKELIARQSELDAEITSVDNQIDELYDMVEKIETDEEKEEILKSNDELTQKRDTLNMQRDEVTAQIEEIDEFIKQIEKGEPVEKNVDTPQELEKRDVLNAYFHRLDKEKEQVRAAGLVSEDAEVLIPEEIVYQPKDEVYTEQDLEQYISVESVTRPRGSWPIMLRTDEVMHTVEELDENPRLKNPKFEEVQWEVKTYRGVIPMSQESIDDSAVDLPTLIGKHILRIVLNTTNKSVAPLIKAFKPVIAKNLDDLKKLDDVMLDEAYNRAFFMSRSMFHYLNTLKDSDGNYVLQPDITSPSGKSLFGWNIIRLNDTLIGDYNGQLVCFFGDMAAAICKFDRQKISAQWDDHDFYANKIQSGFRADYEAIDSDAGYYVLFAPVEKDLVLTTSDEQTPETVEGVEATIAVENNVATIKYTGLTGQVITYSLKDAKGAIVAEMVGRFTTEKTEDTITVTFAQDMVKGDYTLEAKVLDNKKYKCIKSVKINIKQKSDEIAKTLNASPVLISGN